MPRLLAVTDSSEITGRTRIAEIWGFTRPRLSEARLLLTASDLIRTRCTMTRKVRRFEQSIGVGSLLLSSALFLSACGDDDSKPRKDDDHTHEDAGTGREDAGDEGDGSTEPEDDAGVSPDAGEEPGDEPDASTEADAGEEPGAGDELPTATPKDLALESAADYADNKFGLITGSTLAGWVENWSANRPAGVTGKLVVLQVVPNVAASEKHVAGNGSDVVSYLVAQGDLQKHRNNGLSQIEGEIPNGEDADALLKKYGIDALNDYVVITFEQQASTANSIVQHAGRLWLLLRYWGYPKERVALLNGSVNWNAANQGLVLSDAQAATPPDNGSISVRELRTDNTQLVITLDGILGILRNGTGHVPSNKTTIIDARGGAEALGLRKASSTGKTDCPSYTGSGVNSRCSPLFEGRLKGAHSVPWPQFIDSAENGFRFFDKATVKQTFDSQSEYQADNLVIQYCRTNSRSMVTGLVSAVILGYPTRFYDTSFIEWSHLAYGPTEKTRTLPENSRYRTDLAELTEHAEVENYTPGQAYDPAVHTLIKWVAGPNYNSDEDISNTPVNIVSDSTTASQSVIDDRAYKLQP